MSDPLVRLRHASFASGIGGFDLGFDLAGMESVFQCEADKFCLSILERHWPDVPKHPDLRTLTPAEIPEADVWSCGFPCQDVSVAGRRAGLEGERSNLWFDFIRLVGQKRPPWVVVENVPGLLSSNNGKDLALILNQFEELRYSVEITILDSQFHGVPQRRRRVILVCHDVSGPPKRTSYYAHIGLQALGESLVSALAEAVAASSIAPQNLACGRSFSEGGRRRRMKLFGITTFDLFEKWLNCLDEGSRKFQAAQTNSDYRSDGAEGMHHTNTAIPGFPLETLRASYSAEFGIEWSWRQCWEDLFSEENTSTTSTSISRTTSRRICSLFLALLHIAPYTLRLMHSSLSWFAETSWPLTMKGGLTTYARQTSRELFVSELGGADFWRAAEQCAAHWDEQTIGHLGDLRAFEVLFEREGGGRDPAKGGGEVSAVADTLGTGADRISGRPGLLANTLPGHHPRSDPEPTYVIQDARGVRNKEQHSWGIQKGGPSYTLDGVSQHAIAYPIEAADGHHGHSSPRGDGGDNLIVGTVTGAEAHNGNSRPIPDNYVVAFNWQSGGDNRVHPQEERTDALQANQTIAGGTPADPDRMRETPGIPRRLDSPRYRTLGNAVTVNVARWVGARLVAQA